MAFGILDWSITLAGCPLSTRTRGKPLLAGLFLLAFLTGSSLPTVAQSIYTQAYTFSTFAGEASSGFADGIGTQAQFNTPDDAVADKAGNIYVADTANHTIRKITPAGVVTTLAGFPANPGSADGTGSAARFSFPKGVAVDSAGNVYVADTGNSTIRKITPTGKVSTIAGTTGVIGTNDGPGAAAAFNGPLRLTLDGAGNIYVADTTNCTIRMVTPSGTNWQVSTIAGLAGQVGSSDGPGSAARFNLPSGLAVDTNGNLYVADTYNYTIRLMTPTGGTWMVSTIAGTAGSGFYQNGMGSNARFYRPVGLALRSDGVLFVADSEDCLIRAVVPTGPSWTVSTFAGHFGFFGIKDGTALSAVFDEPRGLTIDATGNLYAVDLFASCIQKVTTAALVSLFAGAGDSGGHVDATGSSARFSLPYGVAVDKDGNVYVADTSSDAIRKISSAGLVITLAGPFTNPAATGTLDGTGTDARFNTPKGVAVDTSGNVYVADQNNHSIRQVTAAGVVTTIAGLSGQSGASDGIGSAARFYLPHTVAVDANTNVYVADTDNSTIRKLTQGASGWMVTTIAGLPQNAGTNDGIGSNARFNFPIGLAVDQLGNIFVGDYNTFTIRKLTPVGTNWMVSTIAGTPGVQGEADGTNNAALFTGPYGVAVDAAGSVYVGDGNAQTMRKIIPNGTDWVVSTIAGMAFNGGSFDGSGSNATFSFCGQVAVDGAGNVFVADTGNDTIRKGVFSQYAAANTTAYTPPAATGNLQVTLLPPEANGQWRFPWEVVWHNSGFTATNVAPGNYPVDFRSVPGWLAIPPSLTLTNPNNAAVVTADATAQITNYYYPTFTPTSLNNAAGSLTVNLVANPPNGAGWRFLGDTNAFFASNFTTNLLPGTYLIEFAGPFNNRATPPNGSVQIFAGVPTLVAVTYPFAAPPPAGALLPTPVPAANITDVADYPFGFNGQLQSEVGFGSGVVVQSNVVLTAAHLVFKDDTLSYVSAAYWFPQEEVPGYVPTPLIARGEYLLSGYAAQRTNDLSSGIYGDGVSSPQSRNLDVAALYFGGPVAGGGYGGYLPSDTVPNQWLTSTAQKMLAGYPVDGSLYGFTNIVPGQMYQIGPQPFPLNLSPDSTPSQQEIYTASWFLSYPGNSGGPLYVQLNGYYYPAGVYLGTLNNQSVVRGIDSNVVNLVTLAATLGDNGTNFNGGGVIQLVSNEAISAVNAAYLQIQIQPPSAVQAGGGWKLQTDSTYANTPTFTRIVTSTNVAVQFNPIPGWNLPTNQTLTVTPGFITTNFAFYTVRPPTLVAKPQGLGLTGTTNTTYRIESTTSLKNPVWTGLSTNTIVTSDFNLFVSRTNQATTFYRAVWLNR